MENANGRLTDLGANGAPARLGLMGGTFDPIHIGHLRIAEEVRENLALDGVLFIPTGNPVFKRDQQVTDAQTRLAIVREAVAGNPHFDVSSIEVDRSGDTYTIDTVKELRLHYPGNVEFYFIIGADVAETIGKWRGCSELASLIHLVVAVGRPGFPHERELRESVMDAAPFDLHMVRVSSLEVSSSRIRNLLERGMSARYLVPEAALGQIVASQARQCVPDDLERGQSRVLKGGFAQAGSDLSCEANPAPKTLPSSDGRREGLEDPLSKRFFKARKAELEQRVSAKRFKHSLGVSDACVKLAKTYGVDAKKARLAGLLHDWDKGYDDDGARARVHELDMEGEIDPRVVKDMPRVLHGMTAARALSREFPEIPDDVLQAIRRHTTADIDMSPLDMVLYIADAIEPSRRFGRIDELRSAVGHVSLEELYFQTYEYWVFLLLERRQPLHPDTIRIWNDYAMRRARERKREK